MKNQHPNAQIKCVIYVQITSKKNIVLSVERILFQIMENVEKNVVRVCFHMREFVANVHLFAKLVTIFMKIIVYHVYRPRSWIQVSAQPNAQKPKNSTIMVFVLFNKNAKMEMLRAVEYVLKKVSAINACQTIKDSLFANMMISCHHPSLYTLLFRF